MSKPEKRLSRQQIRANLAREKRKAKLKLQRYHGHDNISNQLINERLGQSQIDRIVQLLPSLRSSNAQRKGGYTKKFRPPQDPPKTNSRQLLRKLPFKPLKRNVQWLHLQKQDSIEKITLTEELKLFAEYVQVCYLPYLAIK